MKRIFILIAILCLAGCQSIDTALSTRGVISSETSKIDGRTIVTMSPVLPKHGHTDIQAEFGLYWDTPKANNALLVVEIDGAQSFNPERAFDIKVDGELLSLPPASSSDYGDVETEYNPAIGYHNKSRKYYIIEKNHILKIANGNEAYYRIWFMNNSYAEGEISYQYQDYQSYIPSAFRNFYSVVWKL